MDLTSALEIVWQESARSSQSEVARAIGVSPATITHWKNGKRPDGNRRAKLLAWAERIGVRVASPPPAISPAIVLHAQQQLAETHRDLARIYDYAESIADLAEQVALKQRGLLTMLGPWVASEVDVKSGKVAGVLAALAALDAETEAAATPTPPADAAPAAARRKKKSTG